ncbi:CynX/NimT family MFS transporter [Streptomyces sulphureus]|uniref:CynX/NimT family MFS transporter n=1 Tax=Streptomyces sulphureus TaxID=47758 RepID=UPI00038248D3|nr:MFS transporter [Streptomyces sulphureus]
MNDTTESDAATGPATVDASPVGRHPAHEAPKTAVARRSGLLVAGIVLLALNLRPALVAVSPLAPSIGESSGMSSAAISLLTSLPLLCFGLLAPISPRLGRRLGMESALLVAMALVVVGTLVRLVPSSIALFGGTVVIGAGIAVGNVLLPGLIKRDFPHRVGPMMGVFSMTLFTGAASAAGLSVPVQQASGADWRVVLAGWGVLALVAGLVWLPQLRNRTRVSAREVREASHPVKGLWRQSLAWQVAAFMGLQSLTYYAATAWLPAMLESAGMSSGSAGWMLSFSSLLGIAGSFFAPVFAERRMRPAMVTVLSTALCAGGLIGMLVMPVGLAYLWMVLLGLGQGGAISLALLFIVQRAPDARHAAQLSSMAQGFGYVLAATGPVALGALHDVSGNWTLPLGVLSAMLAPQLLFGMGAARNRHVTEDASLAGRK